MGESRARKFFFLRSDLERGKTVPRRRSRQLLYYLPSSLPPPFFPRRAINVTERMANFSRTSCPYVYVVILAYDSSPSCNFLAHDGHAALEWPNLRCRWYPLPPFNPCGERTGIEWGRGRGGGRGGGKGRNPHPLVGRSVGLRYLELSALSLKNGDKSREGSRTSQAEKQRATGVQKGAQKESLFLCSRLPGDAWCNGSFIIFRH